MVSEQTAKKILDIFLHNQKVGTLNFDGSVYHFSYEAAYLAQKSALPLSLSLPLTKISKQGAMAGKKLPLYFFHLMPEGWLLNLARAMKLPVQQPMDVLALLLVDTIGAVRIVQHKAPLPAALALQLAQEPLLCEANPSKPAAYVKKHSFCLFCAKPLLRPGANDNYHPHCATELFATATTPRFHIDRDRIRDIAMQQLGRGESLTGVQEKFSFKHRDARKTIAPPLSFFVAKPQPNSAELAEMANLEGAYMLFARLLGLPVAKSGLIYMADGTACFLSRRFDISDQNARIHQEDMAAPLGKYNKYESSHESIAKILVENHSLSESELYQDRYNFLKITLFNFILGNTDAHLKNFSLFHFIENAKASYRLTPFYDIFPSLFYSPKDTDELGISLGNRKNKLKKQDFENLARLLLLGPRTVPAFITTFKEARELLLQALNTYEVTPAFQYKVLELAKIRLQQLGFA